MSIVIHGLNGKGFIVDEKDSVALKMAMLIEGQCMIGVAQSIKKYDYTEQRYYQLLKQYNENGSGALINKKRGSNKQAVRTKEVTNQIIRLRFLDPFASADVIAQKLQQLAYRVSKRSVERTITEFGLQKKHIR